MQAMGTPATPGGGGADRPAAAAGVAPGGAGARAGPGAGPGQRGHPDSLGRRDGRAGGGALPGCADCWSPKVVRAAMGSLFHLPVCAEVELSGYLTAFAQAGGQVIGDCWRGLPL